MNMNSDHYKELRDQLRSENSELVDKAEENKKVRDIRFNISALFLVSSLILSGVSMVILVVTNNSDLSFIPWAIFMIALFFIPVIIVCAFSADTVTDLDKQVNDLINEKFVKDLKDKYDAVLNNSESVLIDEFGRVIENFRIVVDDERYDAVIVYKNDEVEILEAKPVVEIATNPLYKKKAKNREDSEINVFDLKESLNKI